MAQVQREYIPLGEGGRDSRPIRWLVWVAGGARMRRIGPLVSYIYIYTVSPCLFHRNTLTIRRDSSSEFASVESVAWASLPLDLARANPLFQRGIDVRIVYEACEERKRGYIQVAIGGHDSILHKGE